MAETELRIGIIGCGRVARIHVERLRAVPGARIVGCADPDQTAAAALAATLPEAVPTFADARELLARTTPAAVAIFTPHRTHYRLAMDALQADCHVFIEKPLSTNAQEAHDIVKLARARGRKVGVGHQYRLSSSFAEVRRRLAAGAVGRLRLVTATLAQPWLAAHTGPADSWRLDPRVSGGGILADVGDHLLDTLLWTTDRVALEVAAFQERLPPGLDVATAAAVRLSGEALGTISLSGTTPGPLFELTYLGEEGRLRATDRGLWAAGLEVGAEEAVTLADAAPPVSIDANFVAAVLHDAPLCCPAEAAIETVRLLEALVRSAAGGQIVRLG